MKKVENFHNWFAGLPKGIQQEIQSRFVKKTYEPGAFLYRNGEPSDSNFQITSGKIKICNFSDQGQEIIISHLYPGDWCGDVGLITKSKRFNNAVAVDLTTTSSLSKKDFYYFYEKYPEISKAINIVMCTRLQSALTILEDASLLPLSFRLARTISRLGFSIGEKGEGDNSCIIRNLSHEDLGRLVGATRQSVSRELKRFEKKGLLTLKYGKIIISDLQEFSLKFDNLIGHEPIVATYDK